MKINNLHTKFLHIILSSLREYNNHFKIKRLNLNIPIFKLYYIYFEYFIRIFFLFFEEIKKQKLINYFLLTYKNITLLSKIVMRYINIWVVLKKIKKSIKKNKIINFLEYKKIKKDKKNYNNKLYSYIIIIYFTQKIFYSFVLKKKYKNLETNRLKSLFLKKIKNFNLSSAGKYYLKFNEIKNYILFLIKLINTLNLLKAVFFNRKKNFKVIYKKIRFWVAKI